MAHSDIILRDSFSGDWWRFTQPIATFPITNHANLPLTLHQIEARVQREGVYAAGFLTYESASAFDPAFVTYPSNLPDGLIAWFGLYERPQPFDIATFAQETCYTLGEWRPTITEPQFLEGIEAIKQYIAQGETYQVNSTFQLKTMFEGCPEAFFADLQRAQMGAYGAFVDLDNVVICSASPELFFTLDGARVESRPMKGTAPRGRTLTDDNAMINWLKQSEKNRAENVMIVDMIRNDIGRIAHTGSVRVPNLFDVTRYPTVLQMTSTVEGETDASWADIVANLFPCASITGAPKVRTMEIIRALEVEARGVYTGSIGYLAPGRRSQFNVAIRTVTIDRTDGIATFGTGSGVTWDSDAQDEYQECLVKTAVLTEKRPDFHLLEAILWRPESGYWLLPLHLDRLAASATYFGFPFDRKHLISLLDHAQPSEGLIPHISTPHGQPSEGFAHAYKVRVRLFSDGEMVIEPEPLLPSPVPMRVCLSDEPVASGNRFLYHKTSNRDVYAKAKAAHPECDDVILWNERGEITESCTANVILAQNGRFVTPPLASGLLPGVLRQKLLNNGDIVEEVVMKDFLKAGSFWLVNSVRGWRRAVVRTNDAP